jgi:hypothetical protein
MSGCDHVYDDDLLIGQQSRPGDICRKCLEPKPGACADPSCPVLHADPANPIHPPFYEPGGPFVDTPAWANEGREYTSGRRTGCTPMNVYDEVSMPEAP